MKIADDVYVLELGRNKFEGPAEEFYGLEKALWVVWIGNGATFGTVSVIELARVAWPSRATLQEIEVDRPSV